MNGVPPSCMFRSYRFTMPYRRQRPRIAHTGRVTVRLSTEQRDLFIHHPATRMPLGHALHRAPVRKGELSVRVNREELEQLIAVAADFEAEDKRSERALASLLRYLETLEDRFEDPEELEEALDAEEAASEPRDEQGRG